MDRKQFMAQMIFWAAALVISLAGICAGSFLNSQAALQTFGEGALSEESAVSVDELKEDTPEPEALPNPEKGPKAPAPKPGPAGKPQPKGEVEKPAGPLAEGAPQPPVVKAKE